MIEVVLPALTWTMTEARIVKWLKSPGEQVDEGQPLFEVEMEKAVVEVESPGTGTLAAITADEDTIVPFLQVVGLIATEGEDVEAVASAAGRQGAVAASPAEEPPAASERTAPVHDVEGIRATPLAKKVARELGVSLSDITDRGPSGRIRESDVRAYADRANVLSQAIPADRTAPAAPTGPARREPWPTSAPEPLATLVQVSRLRRVTGERMRQSVDAAPHFWLHRDLDMTELENARAKLAPRVEEVTGSRPSVTGMLVKVVGAALRRHPNVNASFDDGQVRLWSSVNIGVAMATADGLVVPVIHEADQKTVEEITRELGQLREKSLKGEFRAEDLTGGTFTISNLGMFGVDFVDSIINPPEAALLSAGRTVRKPVVVGDAIEIRPMVHLCLAVDHRVLDGVDGARFLGDVAGIAENPFLLI